MHRIYRLTLPMLLTGLALSLAGCVNDSASYMIDGDRKHAVTLIRAQPWFWSDQVTLSVVAARQPECYGGLDVEGVPRMAKMALYLAPDEYAERIFILEIEGVQYAVGTTSCRVQKFAQPVSARGELVGAFQEDAGTLGFVATQ
jgi:hypothetical protein